MLQTKIQDRDIEESCVAQRQKLERGSGKVKGLGRVVAWRKLVVGVRR